MRHDDAATSKIFLRRLEVVSVNIYFFQIFGDRRLVHNYRFLVQNTLKYSVENSTRNLSDHLGGVATRGNAYTLHGEMERNRCRILQSMAISSLRWRYGWETCSNTSPSQLWLNVLQLQAQLQHCPSCSGRCKL